MHHTHLNEIKQGDLVLVPNDPFELKHGGGFHAIRLYTAYRVTPSGDVKWKSIKVNELNRKVMSVTHDGARAALEDHLRAKIADLKKQIQIAEQHIELARTLPINVYE